LLTFVRFAGSAVLGFLTNAVDSSSEKITTANVGRLSRIFFVPALLLLGANYMNGVALQLAGITLTYVVKSAIPVATVIVNKIQGTSFPLMVYATLVPTVIGVMLAAWGDMEFSFIGFFAAVLSMALQTMLNLESKKAISETNISGVKAQFIMASISTIVLGFPAAPQLTAFLVFEEQTNFYDTFIEVLPLSAVAAFAYHVEYVSNFLFTARVTPLAFSIADICRRLCIIAVGSVLFNKPLSSLNKTGILICFTGVLWYTTMDKSVPTVGAGSRHNRSTSSGAGSSSFENERISRPFPSSRTGVLQPGNAQGNGKVQVSKPGASTNARQKTFQRSPGSTGAEHRRR